MPMGYARVSTKDQTVDLQVDALTQAGCTKVYTEVISGAPAERTVPDQLLETLRAGDMLVIWKLDRLGRSVTHLLAIVTALMARQLGLKSFNDPIDTTTPQGRLIFNLFAPLAEFEREVISEHTQAGLSAARARRVGPDHAAGNLLVKRSCATMSKASARATPLAEVRS
jgi:DNA invertase Pin-like site-specific DNA recombinase